MLFKFHALFSWEYIRFFTHRTHDRTQACQTNPSHYTEAEISYTINTINLHRATTFFPFRKGKSLHDILLEQNSKAVTFQNCFHGSLDVVQACHSLPFPTVAENTFKTVDFLRGFPRVMDVVPLIKVLNYARIFVLRHYLFLDKDTGPLYVFAHIWVAGPLSVCTRRTLVGMLFTRQPIAKYSSILLSFKS